MKIDVEGQEFAVLNGAKLFFEQKRVKAVYLDGFKNERSVIDFLKGYGFSFFDGRTLEKTDGMSVFSLLAISE